MKKIIAGAVLVVGGFLAGAWYSSPPKIAVAETGGRRVLKYACPMHPQVTSDRPGTAPCCGMALEPVYAGPAAPAAVALPGERRAPVGVRVAQVERSSVSTTLRLVGRVAADEARLYRVSSSTDGLVREIAAPAVGSFVKKGDLLARLFSRDVLTPQQGYVYALTTRDRMKREATNTSSNDSDPAALQVYTAEQNLRAVGLSDEQIEELRRSRTAKTVLELRAPIAGVILTRNLTLGLRTERNLELYRIADLSRVWVLADLYERDAALVGRSGAARVRAAGRTLPASLAGGLPPFDVQSRTFKLRLEVDNAGYLLRPDMFVDVELPVRMPPQLTVPADAVIDTGVRRLVYVETGNGSFQPRAVQAGWRAADRVAITSGLQAGERIVVDGTFLIDSESRLKLAQDRP
jgi:Cu(I)/Ag(I) efflux system membrane fusion protein